ncbi:SDR family oxidoreductase [candidate division KSB1 bacterium]|nr:SDR family oxidoreductase [candidate division KSB1 bacterium]
MKVAVLTGAGGTLASEMARHLAGKGVHVALMDLRKENVTSVEQEIKSNDGQVMSFALDVTSLNEVNTARDEIVAKWGPVSILINAAGGNQMDALTNISEFDPDELAEDPGEVRGFFNLDMDRYEDVVKVNSMGTVIPCQVFARDMAKNGGGSIINFASMNSYRPLSRVAAYAMAKAGISTFTQWLANYLAPANIRVNAIAPGFFLNERSRKLLTTPEGGFTPRGESIMRQTPLKRFGEASDLIGTMNWLIDDQASGFVTGITIPVDGGFLSCSGV